MHKCRGELGELGELGQLGGEGGEGGEKFLQIFQIFQHGHGTAKNISAAHTSCIFFLQWIAEINHHQNAACLVLSSGANHR